MAAPVSSPPRVRFGPFELDRAGRELLEEFKPVHIPEQQMTLLLLLTAHPGALVTRDQVRNALWPDGTFVDFERGINTAVRRLRVVLHDNHEEDRYIATVPGRGYRFLVPMAAPEPAATVAAAPPPRRRLWPMAAAAALLALAAGGWIGRQLDAPPQVLHIRALTTDGGLDLPARPASYGSLVYYLDRAGGHWNLMSSTGDPASARTVPMPFENTRLISVSRDGSEWLLGSFRQRGEEAALWKEAQPGGAPVRLGALRAYDAVWDPDGAHIEYSSGGSLWQAGRDGGAARKLAAFSNNPDWLSWSPDGRRLRFFSAGELWEWQRGGAVHALPYPLPRCCGAWSRDGRYFFFSVKENGLWTIWGERVAPAWTWDLIPSLRPAPVRLVSLPRSSFGAFTGFGDDQLVFYEFDPQPDPERCSPQGAGCQPLLPGRSALQIAFSPDGRRLAYVDTRDRSVWTADVGPGLTTRNFRQLSPPGLVANQPRWSHDGQWIAYSGYRPGQVAHSWRIPAAGGPAIRLVSGPPAGAAYQNPDWSPDNHALTVEQDIGHRHGIVTVAAGRAQLIPGSDPFMAPHWSPDGAWLSTLSTDQHQIAVYNLRQHRWQTIARGAAFSAPLWSRDGRYLYFQDLLAQGEPIYRAQAGTWKMVKAADCGALLRGGVHRCALMGTAPDGELLLALNGGGSDLYAATLKLP